MTVETVETAVSPPTRFRAGEKRAARIGRVLKVVGRIRTVDDELMTVIGQRFMERDEIGAALARAIRSKDDGRVTMAQFHLALAEGIATVEDAPPALRAFSAAVDAVPETRYPNGSTSTWSTRARGSTGASAKMPPMCCFNSPSSAATASAVRPTFSSPQAD